MREAFDKDPYRLLEIVAAGTDDGRIIGDLLDCFHRGYPLENLRPLFSSDSLKAEHSAVWIASELGIRSKPFVSELCGKLSHPERIVRFDAINALILATDPKHGRCIGNVLLSIDDPEEAVSYAAINFAARISDQKFRAGIACICSSGGCAAVFENLRARYDEKRGWENSGWIIGLLESDDELSRGIGLAVAFRVRKQTLVPLRHAEANPSKLIARMAGHWLAHP